MRLVRRLKLTNEADPVKIEFDLNGIVEPDDRGALSLRLILHGRRVCKARKPLCDVCILNDICPSAFKVRRGTTPATAKSPSGLGKRTSIGHSVGVIVLPGGG